MRLVVKMCDLSCEIVNNAAGDQDLPPLEPVLGSGGDVAAAESMRDGGKDTPGAKSADNPLLCDLKNQLLAQVQKNNRQKQDIQHALEKLVQQEMFVIHAFF